MIGVFVANLYNDDIFTSKDREEILEAIKCIYASCSDVLADILSPIVPNLKGTKDEAEFVAEAVDHLFDIYIVFSFGHP